MHILFEKWEDKIFQNDPKTKEKITKLIGEMKKNAENNKD